MCLSRTTFREGEGTGAKGETDVSTDGIRAFQEVEHMAVGELQS